MSRLADRATVLALALLVLAAVVGLSFAAGYLIGKVLL